MARTLSKLATLRICEFILKTKGLWQLIPEEQARKLANRTVIFPNDPQRRYVIELDVFHQLHCLVKPSYSSSL